jgi:hypothetical protein
MATLTCADNSSASLIFKATKNALEIRIKSSRVPEIVAAIRSSYNAITVGYHPVCHHTHQLVDHACAEIDRSID